VAPKTIEIQLKPKKKLKVQQKGKTYTFSLFEQVASGDYIPTIGTDGKEMLMITDFTDSPSDYVKILQWLGEKSAGALFIGLNDIQNQNIKVR